MNCFMHHSTLVVPLNAPVVFLYSGNYAKTYGRHMEARAFPLRATLRCTQKLLLGMFQVFVVTAHILARWPSAFTLSDIPNNEKEKCSPVQGTTLATSDASLMFTTAALSSILLVFLDRNLDKFSNAEACFEKQTDATMNNQ
jgi:hypothetical protein